VKKTTQQRACIGLILVAALLIKIPLANAQQKSFVFPQVADGVFDGGYYKTTFMILPAYESSTSVVTCGFVLHGLGVDLDGKGLVTGWTAAISPGSYYVSSSSADQQLRSGYATLSCTDYVYALVLYSAFAKDGTGTIAAVFGSSDSSCSALNSAQMAADQQGGSQLGIAIANNTTQTQTYRVIFNSSDSNSLQGTVTVPAQTSVAKFLTDILPASSNRVGWVEIIPADHPLFGTGFSAIALRYTGATFTTIPVSCYLC
jgi:hypothetical protein